MMLLHFTLKTKAAKAKLEEGDCTKLKSFHTAKETIIKTKRQPKEWKKQVQTIYLIGVNMQNIEKLLQFNSSKNNQSNLKM